MQPYNGKQHILHNMQHNRDASRQQLGPNREVQPPLGARIDAEGAPHDSPQDAGGGELAGPRSRRGDEGEAEVVEGLVGVVEGEVRVDVLVGAEVEDEHAAEEREHARVLGQESDEHVTNADLLVRAVGLARQAEEGEQPVVRPRHRQRRERDQEPRRERLQPDELRGRAQARV